MKKMIILLGLCTMSQICFNSEKSKTPKSKSAQPESSTYSRDAALAAMPFYNPEDERPLNSPRNSKPPQNS